MQGDSHFAYDAYGNLSQERRGTGQRLTRDYRYDSQQRLTGITLPDGSQVTYRYDAFGRRIAKEVDGTTTQFIWQGERLIAESAQQKGLRGISHYSSYLYEPGTFKPLALLQGEGKSAQIYHYQLDHLGTPQELTSHRGQIVWSANYRAYGNVLKLDIAEVKNPLRFQGQYHDEESGLHYNRHRYYNPNTGRYQTPDPIKLAGGLNSYQYVPNPTGWVDPLGLSCVKGDCPGQESQAPSIELGAPEVPQTKPDFYVGPSGPDSTLPATGYRYMRYKNDDGEVNGRVPEVLEFKEAPVTYAGFEKHDSGKSARTAFQVKGPEIGPDKNGPGSWSDSRLRAAFDSLQLFINGTPHARIPFRDGDNDKKSLEPFTNAYPEYGAGGAQQIHLDGRIVKFSDIKILPEE